MGARTKKAAILALVLCAVLLFCSCGGTAGSVLDLTEPDSNTAPAASAPKGAALALVTTQSRFDTAFGQAVWQAIGRFAGEQGLQSAVYKSEDGDAEAALSTLNLVASGGAKLVVSIGESTSSACSEAAADYPEMDFILLDMPAAQENPGRAIWVEPDAVSLGWAAGYAAVSGGMTDLLCLWDSSSGAPAEGQAWALGFAAGCQDAAKAESRRSTGTGVRLRILGVDSPEAGKTPPAVAELLRQRPQLVVNNFADWNLVSPWFDNIQGLRVFAPLCQEDVPAGKLWALVELEPTELVSQLLADWQDKGLKDGQTVLARASAGARLGAGLAGGTQEVLDDAVQLMATSRQSALQRTALPQLKVFPDLSSADFPDLQLMMLPRDAVPVTARTSAPASEESAAETQPPATEPAAPPPASPATDPPPEQAAPEGTEHAPTPPEEPAA